MTDEETLKLALQMLIVLFLVVLIGRIHAKAGLNPALSLFILIPFVGLLICSLVLAFAPWPSSLPNATEGNEKGSYS